jgi:hypothetical protein
MSNDSLKTSILKELGYTVFLKHGGRASVCKQKSGSELFLVKVAIDKDETDRINKEHANLKEINRYLMLKKPSLPHTLIPTIIDYQNRPNYTFLVLPYYDSAYAYSEIQTEIAFYGGHALSLSLIEPLIKVLLDLTKAEFGTLNLEHWHLDKANSDYQITSGALWPVFNLSHIKNELDSLIKTIPDAIFLQKPSLSNGDFYFRNLISYQQKTVLVDWESARVTIPEETAAYLWVLTFNNPLWQQAWTKAILETKLINPKVYRFYQFLHTLKLMAFWYRLKETAPISLNLFKLLDNLQSATII